MNCKKGYSTDKLAIPFLESQNLGALAATNFQV